MPLSPVVYDHPMQRGTYGAPGALVFELLDDNNNPIPDSGYSVRIQATLGALKIRKSTLDNSIQIDRVSGTVTWAPTEQEVNSVPSGKKLPYSADVIWADGSSQRVLEGFLEGKGVAPSNATRR